MITTIDLNSIVKPEQISRFEQLAERSGIKPDDGLRDMLARIFADDIEDLYWAEVTRERAAANPKLYSHEEAWTR